MSVILSFLKKEYNLSYIFWLFFILSIISRLYISIPNYYNADEVWHMVIAKQSDIFSVIDVNYSISVHPPLYYLVLYYWQKISIDPLWVRTLSMLFFYLSIPFIVQIGKVIGALTLADSQYMRFWRFWLLIIVLLAPLGFTISTEVREYSLLFLLLAISVLSFLKLMQYPSPKYLILYVISCLAAVFSHYSAVFMIFFTGISLLYYYGIKKKSYSFASIIAVLHLFLAAAFFLSFYSHAFHSIEQQQGIRWSYDHALSNSIIIHFIMMIFIFYISQPLNVVGMIMLIYYFIKSRKQPLLSYWIIFYFFLCIALSLILSFLSIYPFTFAARYATWFYLVAMMLCTSSYLYAMRNNLVLGHNSMLILVFVMCVIVSFDNGEIYTGEKAKINEVSDAIEFMRAADQHDIILMDIQSAQALSLAHGFDYRLPDMSKQYHQLEWHGAKVLYPAFHVMGYVDTSTGEIKGSLGFRDNMLTQLLQYTDSTYDQQGYIYITSIGAGYSVKDCFKDESPANELVETSIDQRGVFIQKIHSSRLKELITVCEEQL